MGPVGSQATWMPNERAICPEAAQGDPNSGPKEGHQGSLAQWPGPRASIQVCSAPLSGLQQREARTGSSLVPGQPHAPGAPR